MIGDFKPGFFKLLGIPPMGTVAHGIADIGIVLEPIGPPEAERFAVNLKSFGTAEIDATNADARLIRIHRTIVIVYFRI